VKGVLFLARKPCARGLWFAQRDPGRRYASTLRPGVGGRFASGVGCQFEVPDADEDVGVPRKMPTGTSAFPGHSCTRLAPEALSQIEKTAPHFSLFARGFTQRGV